jgi:hypothetical protein
MIVGVQGTRNFKDYAVFLRGMGTALYTMDRDDKELIIYSAGPYQVNAMALEFSNVSERSFKARGIKIKLQKVPPKWLKDNIHEVDYFAFFCITKEPESDIMAASRAKSVNGGVFRF